MTISLSTDGFVSFGGSGSSGGSGTIISIDQPIPPSPITGLTTAAEALQQAPLDIVVELRIGDDLWVFLERQDGAAMLTAYDPVNGFSAPFTGSTVESAAPNPVTAAPRVRINILPVGGWPAGSAYHLHLVTGVEMSFADVPIASRFSPITTVIEPRDADGVFIFEESTVRQCVLDFEDTRSGFVAASKSFTHSGVTLIVTARVSGTVGNSISLSSVEIGGTTTPIITDLSGSVVQLTFDAAFTFGDIRDAINSSSAFVMAEVIGDDTSDFHVIAGTFTGSLTGGVDGIGRINYAFVPLWRGRSSVADAPRNVITGAPRFSIVTLPNGGWQKGTQLRFVSGKEMNAS